jgi:DNA-binding NtrC family response regulator
VIDDALRRTGNNRQLAAKLLRIPRRTLFRKLRALKTEELDPAGEEKAERPSVRATDGAEG